MWSQKQGQREYDNDVCGAIWYYSTPPGTLWILKKLSKTWKFVDPSICTPSASSTTLLPAKLSRKLLRFWWTPPFNSPHYFVRSIFTTFVIHAPISYGFAGWTSTRHPKCHLLLVFLMKKWGPLELIKWVHESRKWGEHSWQSPEKWKCVKFAVEGNEEKFHRCRP